MRYAAGDELFDLAEGFRSQTELEDQFLADPDASAQSGWFQIISERNCYVVEK